MSQLICCLCLKEILDEESSVNSEDGLKHKACHSEFEEAIKELAKIYEETCDQDI